MNKLLFRIITALNIFTTTNSFAQTSTTYLFRAENGSRIDFNAFTKLNPTHKTYADYVFKQDTPSPIQHKLEKLFLAAQKSYLQDPISVAKASWKKILPLIHAHDWQFAEKEIFAFALMRLAQLESENAIEFIAQILTFHYEFKPSTELFPPNILQIWKDQKKSIQWTRLKLEKWANYDFVVIDGKKINLPIEKELKVVDGYHRFSFISNSHIPITKVVHTNEIENLEPSFEPLILGNCKAPRLNPNSPNSQAIKKFDVVFSDCIANSSNIAPVESFTSNARKYTSPFEAENKAYVANDGLDIKFNAENKITKPFYAKKTFWLGLAAVAAAAVIIQDNQDSDRGNQSTTKSGW